jgi:hypothetical protein
MHVVVREDAFDEIKTIGRLKACFIVSKTWNNLGTISDEYHLERTRIKQREPRRINKIDNPDYLDTVEVIGSIPVAPTVI